ncbi:YihY/virulence factor BrkB family protein [Leucobacter sp. HNU]|uniref:YihY/virulence factor BrkB family protein n=1 Tax=Leucobacter sp. HNU TaxID=3236805 RepID=UPI003A7F7DB0
MQALWQRVLRLRPYRAFSHFTDVGGSTLSAGMSYQALFAVFAALWVGFGVLGILLRGRPELLDTIITQINILVPGLVGTGNDTNAAVKLDVLLESRTFDWLNLVAGASLIWVVLGWFTSTRRSIRLIFDLEVKQYRNAILLKLRDFALAIGFFIALLVSAALTVLSSNLTDFLFSLFGADPDSWLFGWLGALARYGALYLFDVLVLVAIHWFLAEVEVPFWPLLRGAALGGAALFGIKLLGSALLGGATSTPLLATFAVFVGLLLWFNLVCRILLLTSAWIATGQDASLGLPQEEPDRAETERSGSP